MSVLLETSQPTAPVLDVPLTAMSFRAHVDQIMAWAHERRSAFVAVANVHMVMEARRSPAFLQVLRQADLITPDGMPLVWLMRRAGAPTQERVAGPDLLGALCEAAAARGVAVYLLGSTGDVLERLVWRLKVQFPTLRVAGTHAPPFRSLTAAEDAELVREIAASGAGLVLVALGCPKQERWMHRHRGAIPAVMVGLGGAFPIFAGIQRRAPRWAQASGLEWVFRLVQEPGRLWRRYWGTNLPFIWLVLRQDLLGLRRAPRRGG
jgi:N-acetylglucosaminyldiphosphoundecaprenol N-acetyl-beta-D-mannosaminyltransferase